MSQASPTTSVWPLPARLTADEVSRLRRTKSQTLRPAHELASPSDESKHSAGCKVYRPLLTSQLPPSAAIRPFRRSDAQSVFKHSRDQDIIQNCASTDVMNKPRELLDAYAWVLLAEKSVMCPISDNSEIMSEDDIDSNVTPAIPNDKALQFPLGRFFYAIALNDVAIGCISAFLNNDTDDDEDDWDGRGEVCELFYWIGRSYRGRGIITSVVKAFVQWLWDTYPSLIRIDAGVYSTWNPSSRRVLQKSGFELEGVQRRQIWKEGRESDLDVWAVLRNEEEAKEGGLGVG